MGPIYFDNPYSLIVNESMVYASPKKKNSFSLNFFIKMF